MCCRSQKPNRNEYAEIKISFVPLKNKILILFACKINSFIVEIFYIGSYKFRATAQILFPAGLSVSAQQWLQKTLMRSVSEKIDRRQRRGCTALCLPLWHWTSFLFTYTHACTHTYIYGGRKECDAPYYIKRQAQYNLPGSAAQRNNINNIPERPRAHSTLIYIYNNDQRHAMWCWMKEHTHIGAARREREDTRGSPENAPRSLAVLNVKQKPPLLVRPPRKGSEWRWSPFWLTPVVDQCPTGPLRRRRLRHTRAAGNLFSTHTHLTETLNWIILYVGIWLVCGLFGTAGKTISPWEKKKKLP